MSLGVLNKFAKQPVEALAFDAVKTLEALQDATYTNNHVAITTSVSLPMPTGAKFAVVIATTDCWVRLNATGTTPATVPSAAVTNGTGQKFLPAGVPRMFNLQNLASWCLIAAAAGIVDVSYYS